MPRVLAMAERRVASSERERYLASLQARREAATAAQAHFWVFEHQSDAGRFVEFTEAASDESIAAVHGSDVPAERWREVQGG